MAKKINIIGEIHELVHEIETNFQEGVDFQKPYWSLGKHNTGAITHLSPRLRDFLRKKFDFPVGFNDWLDYNKNDFSGNNYYYRLDGECGKGEHEGLYFRHSNKYLEQEQPKKCKHCGELTLEEDGRFWLWDKTTVGKNFGQDSKFIAYFHPECAKKYFAKKDQPSKISRIKDKILLHLDKISFDQAGHLANAELLKLPHEYGTQRKEKVGVYQIKIDNEKINLRDFDRLENEKYWYEIRDAIVNNIKQNISDWEIKKDEYNNIFLQNKKNGVKVWKICFCEVVFKNGKQDWDEIEALINGSNSPVIPDNKPKKISIELTSTEKETIQKFMKKNGIVRLTLIANKLVAEYRDNQVKRLENNSSESQNIQKCLEKTVNNSLDFEQLETGSPSSSNSFPVALVVSLSVGAFVLGGIFVYFLVREKKR
ncbi:MAG: hypothetical protein I3273_05880 [Candidatus Moeniiplasma glomeromycotorum]|nr:hypothetical protein [Candidatus Moeniiplasma glomeromycotorum]MCE8168077.1 hypothetical protein [Candidatus Moeniiplasma glomeromycotorum]MCE8169614.1 hypothetical protein [Candidatus Moeniiplasma glomeromycotorum]